MICPARGIQRMRITTAWKPVLDDGRLLILSPFGEGERQLQRLWPSAATSSSLPSPTKSSSPTPHRAARPKFCRGLTAEQAGCCFRSGREPNAIGFGAHPFELSKFCGGTDCQEDVGIVTAIWSVNMAILIPNEVAQSPAEDGLVGKTLQGSFPEDTWVWYNGRPWRHRHRIALVSSS